MTRINMENIHNTHYDTNINVTKNKTVHNNKV